MAGEAGRIIKRKRIKLPGGWTVDIPVIYQITFGDDADRGQETEYTIDNSTDAHRDVHIASVPGGGVPTDESGGGDASSNLQVERIDKFRLLDSPDRGQETFPEPDSKTVTEPPDAPPYFTTHAKTHLVRFINTPDDGNWIKSELIDQIHFGDDPDRGQETQLTLFNPPDNPIDGLTYDTATDTDGNPIPTVAIDPGIEEITSGIGDTDDPVRTDPFQNIVDFSSGGYFLANWTVGGWFEDILGNVTDPNVHWGPTTPCSPTENGPTAAAGKSNQILTSLVAVASVDGPLPIDFNFAPGHIPPDSEFPKLTPPGPQDMGSLGGRCVAYGGTNTGSGGTPNIPTSGYWKNFFDELSAGLNPGVTLQGLHFSCKVSGVQYDVSACGGLIFEGEGGPILGDPNPPPPPPPGTDYVGYFTIEGNLNPGLGNFSVDLNASFQFLGKTYTAVACVSSGDQSMVVGAGASFRVWYIPASALDSG